MKQNTDRKERTKAMTKEFIYHINGTDIHDTEAFGKGWKEAKAIATANHCMITRTIKKGDKVKNEFFAKSGCFLNEKFYTDEKVEIF